MNPALPSQRPDAKKMSIPSSPSSAKATLTHVEVARVVFTYWCRGRNEKSLRQEIERQAKTLANTWTNDTGGLRPQSGAFANPRLAWIDWQLSAPRTRLGWCGAFQITWDADTLADHRGCLWPIESYKEFIRRLSRALCRAFLEPPLDDDPARLEIEPNPFLWTVAIATQPEIEWTADRLRQHARSLIALTIARSQEWAVYTDQEIDTILDNNLAFTQQELQLLNYNTGFLFAARPRLKTRHSLTYFANALIVPNAILRAVRSCIMKFRLELGDHARPWLEQRVGQRRLHRLIAELVGHTQTAIAILAHVEKQCFENTQQFGHQQAVFHRLFERYAIGPLADGLRHQIQQMQAQITDLTEQVHSRSLNLIKLLALVPAVYFGLKLVLEYGPLLWEIPWRDWLPWIID